MYTLNLSHHFSAAHQLTHAYDDKCNLSLHGHNWKVDVEICTEQLVNGMVVDFKKLKEIIDTLDHKNLNEVVTFEPTAENLAEYLWRTIFSSTQQGREEYSVVISIWEADNASITYTM